MLHHLDDPDPPGPDPARYRAVLHRSERLRVEGQRRRTTVGLAALLCLALAAAGWLATQGHATRVQSRETAFQFNEESDPLPPGTPVPASTLTDVVFVSAEDGYGLADHRAQLVLATTANGGSTWRVVTGHLPAGLSTARGAVQMDFVGTAGGYLWEAPTAGTSVAPMWATNDGGITWERPPIGPLVFDVSAVGPDVWALTGSCPPTGAGCRLALAVSTDAGHNWQPAASPPPAPPWDATQPPALELARVTPSEAYVFSDDAGQASLALTSDSGASWTTRPVPCPASMAQGAETALSGTDDLWLVCGGQATDGAQSKALYRSADGGQTWLLAAQTPAFDGIGPPPAGTGSLPLAGYVAPYSVGHKNLAVLSPTDAWLFPTRGDVSATIDGGSTWVPVADLAQADFGSGAPGNVTFISNTDGWVAEFGVGLWHTSDGTDWQPLAT